MLYKWKNRYYNRISSKASRGKELDEEEEIFKLAKNAGNIILTYGMRAITAMMARRVGPTTATRILTRPIEGESDFYRAILMEERLYARTHRFWD